MKRAGNLADDLQKLMDKLCVEKGFCLQGSAADSIVERDRFDAGRFALAVLEADGFKNPEHEVKWREILTQAFIEWFGQAAISKEDYENH